MSTNIKWTEVNADTSGVNVTVEAYEVFQDDLYVTEVPDNGNTFFNVTVDAPGTHTYKVRARAVGGAVGPFSAEVTHTQATGIPEAPSGLELTDVQ